MTDPETMRATAEATKAVAETTGKALDQTASYAKILEGPFREWVGSFEDRLKIWRQVNLVKAFDRAERFLCERGLSAPTRRIPPAFGLPLLEKASLEENDDLIDKWAAMIANASDASSDMELRVSYVEILAAMTPFDVKILSKLAEAALADSSRSYRSAINIAGVFGDEEARAGDPGTPSPLRLSLSNLARLGCALPGGGFDGAVVFEWITVTELGIGLYNACSKSPRTA